MGQVGLYVDVYVAADLTPEVAEGVVFGQIAFAFRINHAVEEAVVQAFVFSVVVTVGDVVQFGVGCHHFFKYAALDNHEAGWRVMNFHKTVFIHFQDDFTIFVFVAGVNGIRSVHALEVGLGRAGRNTFFRPIFAFERINACYNVFVCQKQAVE